MAKAEKKPVVKKEKTSKEAVVKPAVKKAVKKIVAEKSAPVKKTSPKVRALEPKSDKAPAERRMEAMEKTLVEGNSKIAAMMAQMNKVNAAMSAVPVTESVTKAVERNALPWEDEEPGMVEVKTSTPMESPESTDPYVHGQKRSFLDGVDLEKTRTPGVRDSLHGSGNKTQSEKPESFWGTRQPTQNGIMKMSSATGRIEDPVKINRTADGKIRLSDMFQ